MTDQPDMQQSSHPAHNMPPSDWRELSVGPDGNLRESSKDPKPSAPASEPYRIGNTPFEARMKGLGGR